jgi:hypothetical protein
MTHFLPITLATIQNKTTLEKLFLLIRISLHITFKRFYDLLTGIEVAHCQRDIISTFN